MDTLMKEAIELLGNPKSKKRESGAKRLRKIASSEAGPYLLEALKKEMNDVRTWSVQYHIIIALGVCNYYPALQFLHELSERNFSGTILYYALGDAIFRLMTLKDTIEDALTSLEIYNDFIILSGAFKALSFLQLIPKDKTIIKLLELASDEDAAEIVKESSNDKKGLRLQIAAACANWNIELTDNFLKECEKIDDQRLNEVVINARKGKYVKYETY